MAFFNGWPWANFQEQNLDWIIKKVSSFESEVPGLVKDALTQLGYNPDAQNKDFYNARDYGAAGDGSTDDWEALQNLLTIVKDAGGGTVLLPAGVYNTSKTLIVGDNTYLCGIGPESVINCTMVNQFWGTAIIVVGSNSGVMHLKANYYDPASLPIAGGPVNGAIGITNNSYNEAVEQRRGSVFPENSNIIICDVYTDGNYLVQCEPITATRNVIYTDINCPQAMVSLTAGTVLGSNQGHIYNAIIDSVNCGFLRASVFSFGGLVAINNVNAPFVSLAGYNLAANNINIHPYSDSNFARAVEGAPTIANLLIIPSGTIRPIKLSNISVYGSDYSNAVGIRVQTGSGYVLMANVSSSGHENNIITDLGQILGANCVFDGNLGASNTVNGLFVNSKIGTNSGDSKSVYETETGSITYGSGIIATGGWSVNKVVQNGQVLKLFARVNGTFSNGLVLFTTDKKPTTETQAIIQINNSSAPADWKPALATWKTNGDVTITNINTNVANYNQAVIDIITV